ncbi:uncharacterized protein LOC116936745 isoform X3 [Daphnia magna]|uniref:uncharacterized protein LOC116936745 isoform X3 n=1 Tax=Daphnia magna TaxID=35525 RepID=UPI001403CD16|nr:uncharacterized protein LOC116936745 isoform X3 [Daphnia magna]XP_032799823.1 uncharacterized protein LOC116936745 isoform X3 [Daphnia magna]
MARQCYICGFQLQLGISSQLGPYLFCIPTSVPPCILFVCSIHFGSECLKSLNNVWYLRKDTIPTQHLGPYFHGKKFGVLPENELGNSKSKIKNKMEENRKKENITSCDPPSCASLSVFDVDPDMPNLFLDHGECGNPQNLTSRKRKLKLNVSTQIWSYECVSFSEDESSNSSPPPLLRFDEDDKEAFASCLSPKNHFVPEDLTLPTPEITDPEKNAGLEEQTSVLSVSSTAVSPNSRCLTEIKTKLRKPPWRKARAHRYCTFVSDSPFPGRRRTRKTKSKIALSCSGKYLNDIRGLECKTGRQVDEIDGFTISSFFTAEDLNNFCSQHFQMNGNMKIFPNLPLEVNEAKICSPSSIPNTSVLQHTVKTTEEEAHFFSCNSMVVSKNSEVRYSARAKVHSGKSTLRKARLHRYCSSASNFPCIVMPPIKKTKPTRSLLSEIFIGDFSSIECETLRQIDEIDGVTISSFFTSEDLDKFCTQQCQIRTNVKVIPNSPLEYTETEKQGCLFVPSTSGWPDTAEIIDYDIRSAGRCFAVRESLHLAAPDERRSIILPTPSTSSSSSQVNKNKGVFSCD